MTRIEWDDSLPIDNELIDDWVETLKGIFRRTTIRQYL